MTEVAGAAPLEQRNRETLTAFQRAWASKNIDALSRLVTHDVVYSASIGPEPGETWRGREAVLRGFARLFAYDTGEARAGIVVVAGNYAFATWSYVVAPNSTPVAMGCDLFEFKSGLIAKKDAYRKVNVQPDEPRS